MHRKIGVGKPGTVAMIRTMAAASARERGSATSCEKMSLPRFLDFSDATRVTKVPAVIATKSAGICATRPSPTVSSE